MGDSDDGLSALESSAGKAPRPVLAIVAAFSQFPEALEWARAWIQDHWGPIELISPQFSFTETAYYAPSMGGPLRKQFFALQQLMDAEELPKRKWQGIHAERELARSARFPVPRPLNLDPGYLTESKLVLASTKDHAHRIYLGQGIFAEITLRYLRHRWTPWEWTYPDYRRSDYQAFFMQCREYLRRSLT